LGENNFLIKQQQQQEHQQQQPNRENINFEITQPTTNVATTSNSDNTENDASDSFSKNDRHTLCIAPNQQPTFNKSLSNDDDGRHYHHHHDQHVVVSVTTDNNCHKSNERSSKEISINSPVSYSSSSTATSSVASPTVASITATAIPVENVNNLMSGDSTESENGINASLSTATKPSMLTTPTATTTTTATATTATTELSIADNPCPEDVINSHCKSQH
jgi:hypothetical protein